MGMYTSLRVDGILKSDVYPEIRSIMDREGEVAKSYGQGFAMDCRGIYVGMPTPSIWDLASPRLRSLLGTFFEDCRRSFVSPTLGEGGLDVGGVPRRMVIDANLKNYTSTVEKFIHAIPALFESVAVCEWHYEEWDHGMSAELVGSEKMVAKREMERILAAPSGGKASAVLSGGEMVADQDGANGERSEVEFDPSWPGVQEGDPFCFDRNTGLFRPLTKREYSFVLSGGMSEEWSGWATQRLFYDLFNSSPGRG